VSAIALKQDGFGHDDFYGAQLFGRVGYHSFEGITLFADEKSRMVATLGDKPRRRAREVGPTLSGTPPLSGRRPSEAFRNCRRVTAYCRNS
jgi:hypothetical protein